MSHLATAMLLTWGARTTGNGSLCPPGFAGPAEPADLGQPVPLRGMLSGLHVHAGRGPRDGSQQFVLYVNGASTPIAAMLGPGATAAADAARNVPVAAGDVLEVRSELAPGATGARNVAACVVLRCAL